MPPRRTRIITRTIVRRTLRPSQVYAPDSSDDEKSITVQKRQLYAVLDIDNMMVLARSMEIEPIPDVDKDRVFYIRPVESYGVYRVIKRKHLDTFLDKLEERGYKIIVWSAGIASYVKDIANVIMKGRHVEYLLSREHLTGYVKNLYTLTQFIPGSKRSDFRLIDDNDIHLPDQESLVVLVQPFDIKGNKDKPDPTEDDDVLLNLIERVDRSFAVDNP